MTICSIKIKNNLVEVNKINKDTYATTQYVLKDNVIHKEVKNFVGNLVEALDKFNDWFSAFNY